MSQFHIQLPYLDARLAKCLNCESASRHYPHGEGPGRELLRSLWKLREASLTAQDQCVGVAGGAADSADGENTRNTRCHCRRNCFIALDGIAVYWEVCCCCPLLETHFCWKTSQLNERGYLKIMYIANLMHVMLGNLGIGILIFFKFNIMMIVHRFHKWYNKKILICDINWALQNI